ncbi:hypothetical protein HY333_01705 [Candidatus Collierbacteria bacterium]|nr:hypothetical protein [Candidatus Collierbacteria bacterium]
MKERAGRPDIKTRLETRFRQQFAKNLAEVDNYLIKNVPHGSFNKWLSSAINLLRLDTNQFTIAPDNIFPDNISRFFFYRSAKALMPAFDTNQPPRDLKFSTPYPLSTPDWQKYILPDGIFKSEYISAYLHFKARHRRQRQADIQKSAFNSLAPSLVLYQQLEKEFISSFLS